MFLIRFSCAVITLPIFRRAREDSTDGSGLKCQRPEFRVVVASRVAQPTIYRAGVVDTRRLGPLGGARLAKKVCGVLVCLVLAVRKGACRPPRLCRGDVHTAAVGAPPCARSGCLSLVSA